MTQNVMTTGLTEKLKPALFQGLNDFAGMQRRQPVHRANDTLI